MNNSKNQVLPKIVEGLKQSSFYLSELTDGLFMHPIKTYRAIKGEISKGHENIGSLCDGIVRELDDIKFPGNKIAEELTDRYCELLDEQYKTCLLKYRMKQQTHMEPEYRSRN